MSTPFYDLASLVVVPSGYKASKVYAQKPLTTDGQLTFSRASTATRVNSAGLIETVSSNVPRLDYLGSTCPKLQLEPSRTNSLTQNQDFSSGWSPFQCTIGAAQTGPGGANTAYRITNGATANDPYFEQSVTPAAATWCWSIFVKQGTAAEAWLYPVHIGLGADTSYAKFNFSTKTFTNVGNIATTGYEQHANGWYRIWCTVAIGAGVSGLRGRFSNPQVANVYNDWAYPQLEQGAYPTSVILTTTAAVTRLADACSKTGISSLIGQTEGTIFFDAKELYTDGSRSICVLYTNGSSYIQIYLVNDIRIIINGSFITQGQNIAANTRYKIAFAYKAGQHALYVNGVQIATSSSSVAPTVLNDYYLGNGFGSEQSGNYNQALLFKTRLTNAQLAELTSL